MTRLFRWAFNGMCLASVLACMGTAWFWWRHKAVDGATLHIGAYCIEICSLSGDDRFTPVRLNDCLSFTIYRGGPPFRPDGFWSYDSVWEQLPDTVPWPLSTPTEVGGRRFGIGYYAQRFRYCRDEDSRLRSPATGWVSFAGGATRHGEAATLFVGAPLLWLVLGARRTFFLGRCRRTGHCLHCGHNLTGNTSGVCPECATLPPRATTP